MATCVALDRPSEAFDVAERAKARALAERLSAGEEPIGHDVLRDVLAVAERPVLFVHYLTTADRVLVLGFRADWSEPRAVSVRTDRDALRRSPSPTSAARTGSESWRARDCPSSGTTWTPWGNRLRGGPGPTS